MWNCTNLWKFLIKFAKELKKTQLTYYQMVLYTIKKLLPIKNILRTLPFSGISEDSVLEKQQWRSSAKQNKRK